MENSKWRLRESSLSTTTAIAMPNINLCRTWSNGLCVGLLSGRCWLCLSGEKLSRSFRIREIQLPKTQGPTRVTGQKGSAPVPRILSGMPAERMPDCEKPASDLMLRFTTLITLVTPILAAAKPDFTTLDSFLQKSVEEGTVAGGSVLILHQGEVVHQTGFGYSDLESKTPFPADAPVIIASISKPILATAAFRLVEKDKLDMAAPISTYLEKFKNSKLESGEPLNRPPTIGELFTHTSGMRNDEAPGGRPWFRTWVKGKPLSEVIDRFATEFPFKAQPGTRYAYSGIGTDVAARVLEVTSGQPRNRLLVNEVTQPLGMTKTFYLDADSLKQTGPMPSRYYHDKKGHLALLPKRFTPPPQTYSPSGGTIISTASDLARWLLMIRNKGQHQEKAYLSPDTISLMLTRFPKSNNAHGGLFVRRKHANGKGFRFGHTGSSGTNCWIDFENDIIGIVLTQTTGQDTPDFRPAYEKLVTECLKNSVEK